MLRTRLPPPLFEFLSLPTLLELSVVNQQLHLETQPVLQKNKRLQSEQVISYFHFPIHMISISPQSMHFHFQKYMNRLFYFMPELFSYLHLHQITHLDFSYPFHHLAYPRRQQLINQIIDLIETNQTLTYCNLSLFQDDINPHRLKQAVSKHPTLNIIEISLQYSYFVEGGIPGTLYRLQDGTFQWRFYPPD